MTAPGVIGTSPATVPGASHSLYATVVKIASSIDTHILHHGMPGWAVELNYKRMLIMYVVPVNHTSMQCISTTKQQTRTTPGVKCRTRDVT